MDKVNLADKFARFADQWSPKIVGAVDDYEIKLVKLQGEFVWHHHAEVDEMFLVCKGSMIIHLRDRDVNLNEGEFFVVPRGVEHLPEAAEECSVLLFERKGTVNTGDVRNARTVAQLQHL
ncbi:MAG: cupin domain-containing protein [Alphaproteobacteria bacterium]